MEEPELGIGYTRYQTQKEDFMQLKLNLKT